MYACTGRYRISMGVTGMAIVRAIVGGERDPGSWRSCGIGAVTRSLRTLPPLVLAHPASAHTPNASCFPDRSPLRWVEPRATLRLPHRCPAYYWFSHDSSTSCYPPSEHDSQVGRHSDSGLAFSRKAYVSAGRLVTATFNPAPPVAGLTSDSWLPSVRSAP